MTGPEKTPQERLRELRQWLAEERRQLGEEEVRRGRRGPRTRREIEIWEEARKGRRPAADDEPGETSG
ncbi:hypothetical protein [Actinomadura rugatobispora]|uniref:Uncharacterized protein n=1 Tax=Actinomadura rugatobispora TaxID=1994 RepID=A0ABW1A302_9ACTN